jgi:hypothetical protein
VRAAIRDGSALVLAAFAALSVAPLVALLYRATSRGETLAGPSASLAIGDQYRYLDWVRQASDHVLIAGPGGSHVYFNPVFLISGLLVRAGVGIQLAYQLWLPVAIIVMFIGYRAFVWRRLEPGPARPVALALALMASSPLLPVLDYGGIVNKNGASQLVDVSTHLSSYWQAWGYFPTALALGLMALFLTRVDDEARSPAKLAALGATAALLDPWVGLTLAVLTVAVRRRRSWPWPLAAIVAALVYYAALARVDSGWSLSQLRTSFDPLAWTLPIVFGPLLIGTWLARRDRQQALLWLWLLVSGLLFCVLGAESRLTALEGASLPAAMLVVRGWRRFRLPRWAAVAGVALLLLPGAGYAGATLHDYVNDRYAPWALAPGELQALRAAAHAGGLVLTTEYLAPAAYVLTGHAASSSQTTEDMFAGKLTAAQVGALLAQMKPRVVIEDCGHGRVKLALLGYSARRYGCATLYRLNSGR